MKVCVIGCGLRTPLLVHGLVHSDLEVSRIALYDIQPSHAQMMAGIGAAIAQDSRAEIVAVADLPAAVDGSSFVINSIRVGGMEARARDERLAVDCGFAGQETTGPAGFAMALRTIPVVLEQARLVERVAPSAWFVNLTNPAGIITQAISDHTAVRTVGICDTPAELFLQIARALGEPLDQVECDYFGLNHLGWVRDIRVRGQSVFCKLMNDESLLARLYPAELFPAALLRSLGLIPSEYVFFYYRQDSARTNQLRAGATRGEELVSMNREIFGQLEAHMKTSDVNGALQVYRRYVNRRNASYLRLEGAGETGSQDPETNWDPFEGATGYHRIAADAIHALQGREPSRMVLNVPNRTAIEGLEVDDIVEAPCLIDRSGARAEKVGLLPQSVRGLVLSVKQYERLTIQAALDREGDKNVHLTTFALMTNPIVASWDAASQFVGRLSETDQI